MGRRSRKEPRYPVSQFDYGSAKYSGFDPCSTPYNEGDTIHLVKTVALGYPFEQPTVIDMKVIGVSKA